MSSILEIEAAIEKLPGSQVDELAIWLEAHRSRRGQVAPVDGWFERARGAAIAGVTTADVLAITRGEP